MKYGCHIHRTKATTYHDHALFAFLITLTEVTISSHLPVPYHDKVPSHTAPQIPGISLPGTKHVWAFTLKCTAGKRRQYSFIIKMIQRMATVRQLDCCCCAACVSVTTTTMLYYIILLLNIIIIKAAHLFRLVSTI